MARAKKRAKASKVGNHKNKEFWEVAPSRIEAQVGPVFVQNVVKVWNPVFPQPQLDESEFCKPMASKKIVGYTARRQERQERSSACNR